MRFRSISLAFLHITGVLSPLSAQQNCAADDAECKSVASNNPMHNPLYLYPWLAQNSAPLAAGIQAQGLPAQWMMMANHFMSAPIDEATRFSILDAMLRAANMQMLEGVIGGANQARMWIPSQSKRDLPANTVSDSISVQAKRNLYQSLMMFSPLSLRDMISIMADKIPVADDVSFDDAVDWMRLRANEINFKDDGHDDGADGDDEPDDRHDDGADGRHEPRGWNDARYGYATDGNDAADAWDGSPGWRAATNWCCSGYGYAAGGDDATDAGHDEPGQRHAGTASADDAAAVRAVLPAVERHDVEIGPRWSMK